MGDMAQDYDHDYGGRGGRPMGEQADIIIQDGMDFMCDGCGRDREWCECLENMETDAPPNAVGYQGSRTVGSHKPQKKKHMDGCPGRPVMRKNRFTQDYFMGCSAFPKCKFSRDLTPAELGTSKLQKHLPF